ncbi:hypothetical protein [Staphylococcus carnosus]|uniref:Uncharacterized protein n=1 Tax=Staphylococcus carnosus (strain TM300) TaxID=396513 RepID=B9DNF3_STACT|nr:hypothetical protein [Staphylococcus carnosus]QPT04291.1 hypothetical protein I6G40_02150 [Staphylococcus carnosus]QQS85059.1 hypothetical protein I6J04_12065 [Staphylococcus carnosus]QRQ04998.1 hypothetical protein I6J34_12460 [Staphylococcus carnosus]UQA67016.1 hypothetical protein Sta3580_10805 [Staphylococcus carnosus]CAL28168.1 hypothetical protein SCA_1261 [Staphylococcus carnosus subsp. carnosus TM300]
MSKQNNGKNADEQSKAQKLFEQWRKEETLYKEDEKDSDKSDEKSKK